MAKQKNKSLDDLIKGAMKEGPLVAMYFKMGIEALKEKLDSQSDEEIRKLFGGFLNADRIKGSVEKIYNHLNQTEK